MQTRLGLPPTRSVAGTLRLSLRVLGVAFVGILAALLVRNSYVFSTPIYPDGDFAANAILIDEAQHSDLLVGNYSRAGFHHPGPVLLYLQAAGEVVAYDAARIVPAPHNAHLLVVLVFNAGILALAIATMAAHLDLVASGVAAVGAVGLLAVPATEHALLASTWMPHLYVAPFLLLLIAAASVAAGRWWSLPAVALAIGLLVHGHVSFVLFAVPVCLVVAVAVILAWRRGTMGPIARPVVVAAVVGCAFALPILIHTLTDFPGEIDDYLSFAASPDSGGHGVVDVARFVASFWGVTTWARAASFGVAAIVTIALVVTDRSRTRQRFSIAALAVIGGATGLFAVYAATGIDDLGLRYLGLFYLAAPALALGLTLASAGARLVVPGWRTPAVIVVAVVALLTVAVAGRVANSYRGDPLLPEITVAIAEADARDDRDISLDFEHPLWPKAAGIFHALDGRGIRACTTARQWQLLFTARHVCQAGENRRWALRLVADPSPGGAAPQTAVVHRGGGYAVVAD